MEGPGVEYEKSFGIKIDEDSNKNVFDRLGKLYYLERKNKQYSAQVLVTALVVLSVSGDYWKRVMDKNFSKLLLLDDCLETAYNSIRKESGDKRLKEMDSAGNDFGWRNVIKRVRRFEIWKNVSFASFVKRDIKSSIEFRIETIDLEKKYNSFLSYFKLSLKAFLAVVTGIVLCGVSFCNFGDFFTNFSVVFDITEAVLSSFLLATALFSSKAFSSTVSEGKCFKACDLLTITLCLLFSYLSIVLITGTVNIWIVAAFQSVLSNDMMVLCFFTLCFFGLLIFIVYEIFLSFNRVLRRFKSDRYMDSYDEDCFGLLSCCFDTDYRYLRRNRTCISCCFLIIFFFASFSHSIYLSISYSTQGIIFCDRTGEDFEIYGSNNVFLSNSSFSIARAKADDDSQEYYSCKDNDEFDDDVSTETFKCSFNKKKCLDNEDGERTLIIERFAFSSALTLFFGILPLLFVCCYSCFANLCHCSPTAWKYCCIDEENILCEIFKCIASCRKREDDEDDCFTEFQPINWFCIKFCPYLGDIQSSQFVDIGKDMMFAKINKLIDKNEEVTDVEGDERNGESSNESDEDYDEGDEGTGEESEESDEEIIHEESEESAEESSESDEESAEESSESDEEIIDEEIEESDEKEDGIVIEEIRIENEESNESKENSEGHNDSEESANEKEEEKAFKERIESDEEIDITD